MIGKHIGTKAMTVVGGAVATGALVLRLRGAFDEHLRSETHRARYGDYLGEEGHTSRIATVAELLTDGGEADSRTDAYAWDTPLTWLFGNTPQTRIVAAVLSEPDVALDVREISRLSDADEATVRRELETLEHYDLVTCIGDRSEPEFTLNVEHETVENLKGVEQSLLKTWHEKEHNAG